MVETAYQRLLDTLERAGKVVKQRGTASATAQCPAHDDTSPSLSLRAIEGQVLVHCHAGCHPEDVLAALGMTMRDLFDEPPPPGYTPPKRREPSPWEAAMIAIGIHDPPPIEWVLHRIVQAQAEEGDEFPRPVPDSWRRRGGR